MMAQSSINQCQSLEKDEVLHFVNLFSDVLDTITRENVVSDADIEERVSQIKNKFRNFNYMETDFNQFPNLVAYFYCYAPLNAALARNKIAIALENCEMLRNVIRKEKLNIVSLGGGPGTDMIGCLSAMAPHLNQSEDKLNFNWVIAELCPGWKQFYEQILDQTQERNYGYASTILPRLAESRCARFEIVDLRWQPTDIDNATGLRDADLVLLVRVIDCIIVQSKRDRMDLLNKIIRMMKTGAIMIFVGCADLYRVNQSLEVLYENHSEEFDLRSIISPDVKKRYNVKRSFTSQCHIAVCLKKYAY